MIKNHSFYRADDVIFRSILTGLPIEARDEIAEIEVSYTQEGASWWRTIKVPPEQIDTDLSWYVVFPKEETALLSPDKALLLQCLIKFKNGMHRHTHYASLAVKDILVEGH